MWLLGKHRGSLRTVTGWDWMRLWCCQSVTPSSYGNQRTELLGIFSWK